MESCDGIMTDIFPCPTGITENHVKFTGILRESYDACHRFNQPIIHSITITPQPATRVEHAAVVRLGAGA